MRAWFFIFECDVNLLKREDGGRRGGEGGLRSSYRPENVMPFENSSVEQSTYKIPSFSDQTLSTSNAFDNLQRFSYNFSKSE